jgi:hypothetical protein
MFILRSELIISEKIKIRNINFEWKRYMSSLLLVYMCIPVGYNYLENVEIPLTDFMPHLFLPIP